MNYIEIKIEKPSDQYLTDLLMSDMAENGFESFVEEIDHLLAYIPQKNYSPELILKIEALQNVKVESGLIEDQNWNAIWESNYSPVYISEKCFIRAPFHDPEPGAIIDIVLQPKMAFGTAHHETTAMMVELLMDISVKEKRVLDMGCGTGVLAILTALKGATDIIAIDNDEWAFQNSTENTQLNKVEFVNVELGDATSLINKKAFDLILANINKNILLADMGTYGNVLNSSGIIIFSGFYEDDLDDIKRSAKQNGMNFVSAISQNNWVAATFIKQ